MDIVVIKPQEKQLLDNHNTCLCVKMNMDSRYLLWEPLVGVFFRMWGKLADLRYFEFFYPWILYTYWIIAKLRTPFQPKETICSGTTKSYWTLRCITLVGGQDEQNLNIKTYKYPSLYYIVQQYASINLQPQKGNAKNLQNSVSERSLRFNLVLKIWQFANIL